jgi:hypothetical protein
MAIGAISGGAHMRDLCFLNLLGFIGVTDNAQLPDRGLR